MLFKRDIEPSCAYCAHSTELTKESYGCLKHGVVFAWEMCEYFRYDPLRRIPARPMKINVSEYEEEDFSL